MTWVVGGNCFNGFICVADIQATVEFSNSKPDKHFNCVQKIHKVFDNLCIAFSGDIRSGLLIIEELSIQIPQQMNENEYFDIDGQSAILVDYLKGLYNEINPKTKPFLELMFLWTAQEGDELTYRPFCMKFRSPEFRLNSTPQLGVAQSGSGVNNKVYNSIVTFLSGKEGEGEDYDALFGNIENAPNIFTVQKFKNLLFHEASKVSHAGVSKTLISFESVIAYNDIYPEWIQSSLKQAFSDIGFEYSNKKTANHDVNLVEVDIESILNTAENLKAEQPQRYKEVREVLSAAKALENFDSICQMPSITSDKYIDENENIDSKHLITKWPDMVSFLKGEGINIKACNALA